MCYCYFVLGALLVSIIASPFVLTASLLHLPKFYALLIGMYPSFILDNQSILIFGYFSFPHFRECCFYLFLFPLWISPLLWFKFKKRLALMIKCVFGFLLGGARRTYAKKYLVITFLFGCLGICAERNQSH